MRFRLQLELELLYYEELKRNLYIYNLLSGVVDNDVCDYLLRRLIECCHPPLKDIERTSAS